MKMDDDMTWGSERTMQYRDYRLLNCTLGTYLILLTNATKKLIKKIKLKITFHIHKFKI